MGKIWAFGSFWLSRFFFNDLGISESDHLLFWQGSCSLLICLLFSFNDWLWFLFFLMNFLSWLCSDLRLFQIEIALRSFQSIDPFLNVIFEIFLFDLVEYVVNFSLNFIFLDIILSSCRSGKKRQITIYILKFLVSSVISKILQDQFSFCLRLLSRLRMRIVDIKQRWYESSRVAKLNFFMKYIISSNMHHFQQIAQIFILKVGTCSWVEVLFFTILLQVRS